MTERDRYKKGEIARRKRQTKENYKNRKLFSEQ
jgi:hypothetical protein